MDRDRIQGFRRNIAAAKNKDPKNWKSWSKTYGDVDFLICHAESLESRLAEKEAEKSS